MVRISRKFKDISLSFIRNPVSNDILSLNDSDAIKKSVINLVRTKSGERFFNNLLGTDTDDSMFELQTPATAYTLETEIKDVIKNFEPRVTLDSVVVTYPDESNDLNIRISYNIVGLPFPPQEIEFLLQPTRV